MNQYLIIGAIVLFLVLAIPNTGKAMTAEEKSAMAAVSYLDRSDLPLGMRNNNPGNLRPDGVSKWQGMLDTQNNFLRFSAFVWGVRALIKQVRDADLGKHQIRSISDLIKKYSPVSDNSPLAVQNYIKALQRHTGFLDDVIPDTSKDTIRLITTGIANHENGRVGVIDPRMWELAWSFSLV